jgi:hypothetical protein
MLSFRIQVLHFRYLSAWGNPHPMEPKAMEINGQPSPLHTPESQWHSVFAHNTDNSGKVVYGKSSILSGNTGYCGKFST